MPRVRVLVVLGERLDVLFPLPADALVSRHGLVHTVRGRRSRRGVRVQVRPMGSIYVGVNLHPFRGKSGFTSEWNVFMRARPLAHAVLR